MTLKPLVQKKYLVLIMQVCVFCFEHSERDYEIKRVLVCIFSACRVHTNRSGVNSGFEKVLLCKFSAKTFSGYFYHGCVPY